ncbi:MAG: hypothetical protein QOI66_418 [Myxococcales bacterium]|jgi:hypothetical protein|nr:hypothetical protein [Myxococcales bacterium]
MSASSSSTSASAAPSRVVHHGDALDWLRAHAPLRDASVVTSLPDTSEVPHLPFADWQRWFEDAALLVMQSVADEGVAIFFQSDIRHAGLWVDKGALVGRAAQRTGMNLLFHKIVCRKPPGTVTFARAGYSHLLAFSRTVRATSTSTTGHASADVIADAGFKPGVKAMGVNACLAACRFILAETQTRTVVDPFCGFGTVLAVANALGLNAIGVDLSSRMCRRAQTLQVDLDGDHGAQPRAESA